jgi:hypothetical protein
LGAWVKDVSKRTPTCRTPSVTKVDTFFNIDLNHFKTGAARGHDMLIN